MAARLIRWPTSLSTAAKASSRQIVAPVSGPPWAPTGPSARTAGTSVGSESLDTTSTDLGSSPENSVGASAGAVASVGGETSDGSASVGTTARNTTGGAGSVGSVDRGVSGGKAGSGTSGDGASSGGAANGRAKGNGGSGSDAGGGASASSGSTDAGGSDQAGSRAGSDSPGGSAGGGSTGTGGNGHSSAGSNAGGGTSASGDSAGASSGDQDGGSVGSDAGGDASASNGYIRRKRQCSRRQRRELRWRRVDRRWFDRRKRRRPGRRQHEQQLAPVGGSTGTHGSREGSTGSSSTSGGSASSGSTGASGSGLGGGSTSGRLDWWYVEPVPARPARVAAEWRQRGQQLHWRGSASGEFGRLKRQRSGRRQHWAPAPMVPHRPVAARLAQAEAARVERAAVLVGARRPVVVPRAPAVAAKLAAARPAAPPRWYIGRWRFYQRGRQHRWGRVGQRWCHGRKRRQPGWRRHERQCRCRDIGRVVVPPGQAAAARV